MADKRKSLWKLQAADFAAIETKLFLDTHPDDSTALEAMRSYKDSAEMARKEYESLYGSVTGCADCGESWKWVNDPWPWEYSAN